MNMPSILERFIIITASTVLGATPCVRGAAGGLTAHNNRLSQPIIVIAERSSGRFRQQLDADELKDVLRDLIKASPEDFREYRAGPGKKVEDSVVYPCSLAVPGASETSIWIPIGKGQAYVYAHLYSGKDRTRAEALYNDYTAKLKVVFPSNNGRESKRDGESSDGRLFHLEPNIGGADASVVVSLNCYRASGSCTVKLTVRGPESARGDETVEQNKQQKPDNPQAADLKAQARDLVAKLTTTDYEGVRAYFNDQMKAGLPAQRIGESWFAVTQQLGTFQGQEPPQQKKVQGYDVVTIRCRMERGAVDVDVAYDAEGKVGGFWLRPPEGTNRKRSDQEIEKLKKSAQSIVSKVAAEDFEGAAVSFDDQMKKGQPVQRLKDLWAGAVQQLGEFKSQGAPQWTKMYGYDVVSVRCQMERGALMVDITFDDNGRVYGLGIRPSM